MCGSRRAFGLIVVILLTSTSCTPIIPIDPPTSTELTEFLTHYVLYPDITCDVLRVAFAVEYLPSADNPGDIGLSYEEHFVTTADGESLNVWYLPTKLNRGTVVIVQGSTGTMPCYLFLGRLLAEKGWSVIMFDYRGFGGSSGEPDISTLHVDLNAVLDWAMENTDRRVFTLLGVSLGTLPAVTAAVERPELINGVVLDSPIAMGEEVRRLQILYGNQTQTLIDKLPWQMLPEDTVVNLRQPLLIFECLQDTITTPAMVELFFERAGGPKQLIVFPTLSHATAPYHGTGSYSYYLERFLATLWDQYVPFTPEPDGAGDPNNGS